ncbi:MAG: hypothetical protein WAU65_00050 [Candidatus Nanoarchaeia archaeon]
MKDIPRIITGILLILSGLGLVIVILSDGNYVLSGASLILLIIGIVILSNKKENKIEEVKKR